MQIHITCHLDFFDKLHETEIKHTNISNIACHLDFLTSYIRQKSNIQCCKCYMSFRFLNKLHRTEIAV